MIEVLSKGTTTFLVLLVLAGLLWLNSQERMAGHETNTTILKQIEKTDKEGLVLYEESIALSKEQNQLKREHIAVVDRLVTIMEMQERFMGVMPK